MERFNMLTPISVLSLLILIVVGCAEVRRKPLDAEAYNNRGLAYGNKGQLDQAISDYTNAIEINPGFAEAYFNRGLAYRNKGQYDKAISDFNKAIELNPRDAEAYVNRGLACLVKGLHDQAISDFERAMEINPQFVDAYIKRGLAWGMKGYHDRAIADHNKAREITKKETPSKISLTQGYIATAVKKVSPAVVNISTVKVIKDGKEFRQKSLGSGFIIDKEGLVLTNDHIVKKTDIIKVALFDKREFDAKVIGRDPKTDLALIKIKSGHDLPVARLGDSNKPKVRQWVLAIGNPFGLGITASVGIIDNNCSDSSSNYLIRTTSNINPGNSGGALINLSGEVIGINTFGSSQGFLDGNAIPINMVKALVVELKKNGSVLDTKLAQIKRKAMLSTRQFGKESYENSSVIDKTQLENWINQEFIPSRIKSVVLIARDNGRPLGSGFIIDKDGFILTNDHVVEKADKIKVKLADEREFHAKIIGRDPKTDLALIRIESNQPFGAIPLGDSDKLEIGYWVVPIGHPFGLDIPVTASIVSAKSSLGAGAYDVFIQTDAPFNPVSGGGPLLNTAGEVMGISAANYHYQGRAIFGIAIPVNMAKDLLPQLKKGKVVRGWLGVKIQKVTPELKDLLMLKDTKGALVAEAIAGGPAHKAGIKRGDVIVSIDGNQIREIYDLPYIVALIPPGKTVTVEVIWKGQRKSLQVTVGKLEELKE